MFVNGLNWNLFSMQVGYTTRDVVYKWNNARQVAIAEDMKLSQFDLVANPTANQSNAAALSQSELLFYSHDFFHVILVLFGVFTQLPILWKK